MPDTIRRIGAIQGSHPRIHLIEDSIDDCFFVKRALSKSPTFNQSEVVISQTLAEALKRLTSEPPFDLLLMDLSLPDGDSRDVFEQISALSGCAIVILTGRNDDRTARSLMMAGAQDFLSKDNLEPESLSRALSFAIERHHYQNQLAEYQTRLAEAEKLEALGQLVASVAHELKNPLGILSLSTDLLKSELSLSPRHQAALERADRATTRSTNLINSLLDWTSLATQNRTLVKVDLVKVISEIVQDSFADSCTFESQMESCVTNLELTEFQQVIINLLTNAIGAAGAEGSVELSLEPMQEIEQKSWLFSSQLNWDRDYWIFRITNAGRTFPPELLAKVFEAFVSGKVTTRRMGLGLWVASTIASRMRGALAIDLSPREEGAEVLFFIPQTTPQSALQSG